jgi:hypothetical protein
VRHGSYLALLVGLTTWFAAACSGGPGVASLCEENGVTATILHNHPNGPHSLVVPVADVTAGIEVTYDIQGSNTGHGHTVTVTAADFAALGEGTVVTLTSSDTGAVGKDHTHPVTLACGP